MINIFENVFYILIALMSLLLMVTVHEFGHYIAGKRLGFKILEFAIGFGPKIYSKTRKNGEVFSVRVLPLGGFCAFAGEEDEAGESDSFNAHAPWKRIIVFLAGVTMNFLTALLIVVGIFLFAGMTFPTVDSVLASPGEMPPKYLLQEGDIITEINGRFMYLPADVGKALGDAKAGDTIKVKVIRRGESVEVEADVREYEYQRRDEKGELVTDEHGAAIMDTAVGLGIIRGYGDVKLPFFETLWRSLVYTLYLGWMILGTLGALITGALGLNAIGGPITTIGMTAEIARSGIRNLLTITAMIGVNFAVFNLLPIPALDGSKVVFTAIEWVRGKPINRRVENAIHAGGLILLFGFIIVADLFQLL